MRWTKLSAVSSCCSLALLLVVGCKGPSGMDMGQEADLAAPQDLRDTPDLSTNQDQGLPDLAMAPDLATTQDLRPPADLSVPDLSVPDLAMPVDLNMPRDMSMPPDLNMPVDMSMPRDLATPQDLTMPRDMAMPPDLSMPRDMAMPPDMSLPCTGSASCGGATPYCCADFTLGAGTPPMCPVLSFSVGCKNTCNGNIALSCNATDRARLCTKGADCAGDPGGYRNCCELSAGMFKTTMCITDLLKLATGATCVP